MEFKGTKGKWVLRISALGIDIFEQKTGFGIVDFGSYKELKEADYYLKECEHNALLISKAPEMLSMLKNVCTELYKTDNSLATEVKQLIKEATEL